MSCLPFAAWAAKKAAQIVGESGGSSGGGLPVVELSTVVTPDSGYLAVLTAEETAIMEKIADIRQPIYVTFVMNATTPNNEQPTTTYGIVMCPTLIEGFNRVAVYSGQAIIEGVSTIAHIFFEEGAWAFVLQTEVTP